MHLNIGFYRKADSWHIKTVYPLVTVVFLRFCPLYWLKIRNVGFYLTTLCAWHVLQYRPTLAAILSALLLISDSLSSPGPFHSNRYNDV
jgi:hypothetical protein